MIKFKSDGNMYTLLEQNGAVLTESAALATEYKKKRDSNIFYNNNGKLMPLAVQEFLYAEYLKKTINFTADNKGTEYVTSDHYYLDDFGFSNDLKPPKLTNGVNEIFKFRLRIFCESSKKCVLGGVQFGGICGSFNPGELVTQEVSTDGSTYTLTYENMIMNVYCPDESFEVVEPVTNILNDVDNKSKRFIANIDTYVAVDFELHGVNNIEGFQYTTANNDYESVCEEANKTLRIYEWNNNSWAWREFLNTTSKTDAETKRLTYRVSQYRTDIASSILSNTLALSILHKVSIVCPIYGKGVTVQCRLVINGTHMAYKNGNWIETTTESNTVAEINALTADDFHKINNLTSLQMYVRLSTTDTNVNAVLKKIEIEYI